MTARRTATAITAASITALLVWGGPAGAGGRPFEIALSGAEEVPPTDPGNAGFVRLTLNQGQEEICFEFGELERVQGESLPFAGHIHEAERGAIVVPLFSPTTAPTIYPTEERCVEADADLIKEIRQNPEDYYVNLHNQQHPGGFIRGQLAD
ncbi:MAG: CHRD domain-containing protein [Nitriliruptorales bacterium]